MDFLIIVKLGINITLKGLEIRFEKKVGLFNFS